MRFLESLFRSTRPAHAAAPTQTSTCCLLPLVAALEGALIIKSAGKTEWQATNDLQREFLTEVFQPCRSAIATMPEIQSISSDEAETVNDWLAGHGFEIRLQELSPGGFAVASILELLTTFKSPGQRSKLQGRDGKIHDAVTLYEHVSYWSLDSFHRNPVAGVETHSGDVIYMTIARGLPGGFDLLRTCMDITGSLSSKRVGQYSRVQFPMVAIREQPDISWVLGMSSSSKEGNPMTVVQALQQEQFRMNETGARTEVSTAVEVFVTCMESPPAPPPLMIIDRPFLLWIVRPGISVPVFAAYISYDTWRDPGDISK